MNALLSQGGAPLTMTSREIADLVELRHDNVRRTIETLGAKGVIALPQSEEVPNDGPGPKTISIYRVGKRDSYVIVAQLSPSFTARLVDRWQELEATPVALSPANMSRLELLQLAMQTEQERMQLEDEKAAVEAKLALVAPKANALDRIAKHADGSFCLTDAAKDLQMQPKKFLVKLQELGWIHRRPMGGGWLAYQTRIAQGLLEHKVTTGEKSDGTEWIGTQVRVTARGMAKLAEILERDKVAA